jgi:hypothetical protein
LATKLSRPSIPPKRVQRPLITQRLNEGLAFGRRLTLVSAPAGFGKTICISEWVNGLDFRLPKPGRTATNAWSHGLFMSTNWAVLIGQSGVWFDIPS